MGDLGILIAAIFLCLLGNGFFSGSEIAILSLRRSRVDALLSEGSRAAARVRDLQDNIDRFLATAQIGVTVMGTLAGVIGGYVASSYIQPWFKDTLVGRLVPPAFEAAFLVGLAIVYVELIVGELVPKALALRFTEPGALLASWPLQHLATASRWLVVFLTASTRAVLLLFGIRDFKERTFVSEEEIKHLVKEGREQGVLDDVKVDLIHGVFAFSETPVKKVMVPRPKIFALDVSTEPDEVVRLIIESGFSRIPAFDASIDNVIGLAYVKDVLRLLEKRQPVVLKKILHPAYLVPETKKVGDLLKELQKRRTHLALVVDEHGSVSGLVTLEDLIEEIVGEIQDEYDWEERPVERLRDGSLVVEGTVAAADLREKFEVPLPESEDFQTVAGFMLEQLGSVPKGGEVVAFGDYRLTVVDVEKNRISKVKVEKRPVAVKA